jgi:N-acetylneuraminate synthase
MKYCAELGQSHEGSIGYVDSMVRELAKVGVSVVKFQMHIPEEESTLSEEFRVPFSKQDASRFDYWKRTGFDEEGWRLIQNSCVENNLEFLCTPFSPKSVQILEKMKVHCYKIASAEVHNFELLSCIKQTRKPVIISAGFADLKHLERLVDFFQGHDITLLYCVSKYPANVADINLNCIQEIRECFPKVKVGYSDHSGDLDVALTAVQYDIDFLEQHVVYSRAQFGPDSLASVTLEEVKRINDFSEKNSRLRKSYGESLKNRSFDLETLAKFGRGIAPKLKIESGTRIQEEILTTKKPKGGFTWEERSKVIGRFAKRDILPDRHIVEEDLE